MVITKPLCVDVYVSGHCLISTYTAEVIDLIRIEFPEIELHVIDIAQVSELPEAVFATPTYLINGHLWSLGNPSVEQVRVALAG